MAKGVSEIVSQILMILLVLSIGTVILTYSMGYFSGLSGANDLMTKMNGDALKERFIVVNVNVNVSTEDPLNMRDIWVSVYNYGVQNMTVDALYLKGENVNITKTNILPGKFETIHGTIYLDQSAYQDGDQFDLKVVSSLGNHYTNVYIN